MRHETCDVIYLTYLDSLPPAEKSFRMPGRNQQSATIAFQILVEMSGWPGEIPIRELKFAKSGASYSFRCGLSVGTLGNRPGKAQNRYTRQNSTFD